MNRRLTICIAVTVMVTGFFAGISLAAKPNIGVIMADDASWSTFGCMPDHLTSYTPNIDKLAAEGMRLDRFFCAAAMCAPTRHELYTSLHPATSGMYDNGCRPKRKYPNVVDWLGEQGYNVGLTGKLHFNSPTKFEMIPGFPEKANDLSYEWNHEGLEAFMRKSKKDKKPFCTFICSTHSHAPWTCGDPSRFPLDQIKVPARLPDTPATRRALAAHAAEVVELDRQVGETLALIDKLDLKDETLVVFLSEQGTALPTGKYSLYNFGTRAVALFRWPGKIEPGTSTESVAMYTDVVPTLIEFAGGAIPENIDGYSFGKVLLGDGEGQRKYANPVCFAHYQRSLINERYKLIHRERPIQKYNLPLITGPGDDRLHARAWQEWKVLAETDSTIRRKLDTIMQPPEWELYDLSRDPFEADNLAVDPEFASVVKTMKADLESEMDRLGDSYDAFVPKSRRSRLKNRRTGTLARPGINKRVKDGEESSSYRRAAKLREPAILKKGEPIDMFDGKTLNGWFATPRIYVPRGEKFSRTPSSRLYDAVVKHYEESPGKRNGALDRDRVRNKGIWKMEDGVLTGTQVPGTKLGAYLMSEKTYGDFELTLEANPDYPIDTGIMVRAHKLGSVGFQVLVDNRPNGTIGGVFGNSVGSFFAYPFVFDADEQANFKIANIREGDPNALEFRGGQFKTDYAASLDDFKEVWKPNDWNEIKIRCTGRLPLIETWINGVPIGKIDTATLGDVVPDYDAEAIFERIGRKGHIGFEVHDSPKRDRWAPGAECRWRNVRIRELNVAPKVGRALLPVGNSSGKSARDTDKSESISLSKIDGRHWLVASDGKPFFAHGITHVGNARSKHDLFDISTACRKLGFNAYGYGCPEELRSDMPYLESWNDLVPISMYRGDDSHKFPDIFDPAEQARIEAGVKANCAKSKGNPNCIGYCWTDLATWPLENQAEKNWVNFIRSLPDEAHGQRAYQNFLSTWDGADDKARDQAFLRLIAREYFRVIGEANKKHDPDHLIFGDRLSFYTYDADVLKEMLPWVDAIAFQPHFWGPFPQKELDEIHELSGKPILLCDFAIRFKDGDKDVRNWKLSDDSVTAGEAYTDYVKAALKTKYILGVFWCNPIDSSKGFGKTGVKQGFFGDGLTERPGLHEAVRKLNAYRAAVTPGSDKQ